MSMADGSATNPQVEAIIDYIMKKCLWQFHSRAWDRERQNAGVMGQTTQILCGETPDLSTPENRCYWVDAVIMAKNLQQQHAWLRAMGAEEIRKLMSATKERLDYLTIHGSLNQELTDPKY
jgi:nitrogenase delta subunit